MLRRVGRRLYQVGVHPGQRHVGAASMKEWPEQQLPENFSMTHEQRFTMRPFPRDVGRIPRDFVLQVLYQHQPVEVDQLWDRCLSNSGCVLDSKRHLRLVLKQCRDEGWIAFEKDPITDTWLCQLTRERFEEVRQASISKADRQMNTTTLKGQAAQKTAENADKFQALTSEQRDAHLAKLREQLRATSPELQKFERTEVDYLPYTDLNGKVTFMWWYESREVRGTRQVPAPTVAPTLTGPSVTSSAPATTGSASS